MYYVYGIDVKTKTNLFAIHMPIIPHIGEKLEINNDGTIYKVKKILYRMNTSSSHCMDINLYVSKCK